MPSPARENNANAAIAQHVGHWLSLAAVEAIESQYGFATSTLVQQIYSCAVSLPADWNSVALHEHLENTAQTLRAAYPFLTEENMRRLVNCAAYSWK